MFGKIKNHPVGVGRDRPQTTLGRDRPQNIIKIMVLNQYGQIIKNNPSRWPDNNNV